MMRKLCLIYLSLWLLEPQSAAAQVNISGLLEITEEREFAKDEAESKSDINTNNRGDGPFNLLRARLFVDGEVSEQIHVFTEFLFDDATSPRLDGAYVEFSQIGNHPALNMWVGKIPTPFGIFAERSNSNQNPLIGTPLIYQYHTVAQGMSLPADNAAQSQLKDNFSNYQSRGLPILYDACWNTGLEVFGDAAPIEYAVALTKGTVANAKAMTNDGYQVVGRLGIKPLMSLAAGFSAAYGPYYHKAIESDPNFPIGKKAEDYFQTLIGADLTFSHDALEFYAEAIYNRFDVPTLAEGKLTLHGGYAIASYAVTPGISAAISGQIISFGKIDDGVGRLAAWDYDIQRIEAGLVYRLQQNVRIKLVAQFNISDAPAPENKEHLMALQLATVF